MGSRRLGLALIAVGLVGLFALSALGTVAPWRDVPPGTALNGPGWMPGMHGWMHGRWGPAWDGRPAPSPSPGAREVRVTADEFTFSPSRIEMRAGETVNVVLVNEGALPHDLTIPALRISLAAPPGSTAVGALRVDRPGTYAFVCAMPGHRAAGMIGTLVVT